MAIFHLDYVNGNDANDGSTWALAWKTITGGATAARIAPGDTIRIAKSPDPTSLAVTGAWTNLSRAVTLSAALTKNVYLDGAWTASANVTATTSTTRKEGANSSSIAVAAAFTTGKAAYYPLGAVNDFSAYQQLSFWIRTNVALPTADTLRICLCSDTAGATIVDSFSVPAMPGINRWQVATVDKGVALGSSIQSVALYCQTDPGTRTVLIDNIIACKAAGSADSLSLSSLISKNTGTEGWFGIKSINGTAVELDEGTPSVAAAGRGYSGVTETVTTWKRETIKTVAGAAASTIVQEVMDSGTEGNLILFEGGYNTSNTVVDGETIFDGQNGYGYGLYMTGKSFTNVKLSFVRYERGLGYYNSSNNTATVTNASNNSDAGLYYDNGSSNNTVTNANANNNGIYGLYYYLNSSSNTATVTNANNNSYGLYYFNSRNNTATVTNANNNLYGVAYDSGSSDNTATVTNINNNANYGLYYVGGGSHNTASLGSSSGNASGSVYSDGGVTNYLRNSTLNSVTKINAPAAFQNTVVWSTNENNNTDTHFGYTDGGLISSEVTTVRTAGGIAWRLAPTSTNRSSTYPLTLKIAAVACAANTAVTVKAWFRRTSTALTMQLRVKGNQLSGVSNTAVAMTAAIDTWEELSITVTPTQKGVLEFHAEAWGGTTNSGFVDDVTIA